MKSSLAAIRFLGATTTALTLASGVVAAQSIPQREDPRPAQRGSIRVSGYWQLDVMNPDGTIAAHTEFENSLRVDGGQVLAQVVGGIAAVGAMIVELDGAQHPCQGSCLIVPNTPDFTNPNSLFRGPGISPTLVVSSQAGPPKLALTGLSTIGQSGVVDVVRTRLLAVCLPGATNCTIPTGGFNVPVLPFTEFNLSHPISVQNGQVVQVTVTLSFS